LDDDVLSAEPVTDLDVLASDRRWYFGTYGIEMPLQRREERSASPTPIPGCFLRPPILTS